MFSQHNRNVVWIDRTNRLQGKKTKLAGKMEQENANTKKKEKKKL